MIVLTICWIEHAKAPCAVPLCNHDPSVISVCWLSKSHSPTLSVVSRRDAIRYTPLFSPLRRMRGRRLSILRRVEDPLLPFATIKRYRLLQGVHEGELRQIAYGHHVSLWEFVLLKDK